MRLYGVVGWKNAGKTTLMERLVAETVGRGLTVSTVKHAHHAFDVDHPGKDSRRHRDAGAGQVLVCSGARWALMSELRGRAEPPLADLLALLDPVDLVLVEGYKRDRHPKVEAWRPETDNPVIAATDPTVRAVATTVPDHPALAGLAIPLLPLNDPAAVADFILGQVGLTASPQRSVPSPAVPSPAGPRAAPRSAP